MRDPLTNCSYNQVYKNLKEFSQNGENFCKQVTSILQQRANLEFNYAKGLQKLAIKLTKALQSTKKNCTVSAWAWVSEGMKSAADLHQKLGKAIELEAIKPTDQVLSVHEKKRKSLDNEVEKTANLCINNWNQQMKSILELEKERIQLLCNNLNQYTQHISVFGQTLTTCHAQIHCAISKIDVEKDIQALVEETAISSTENKSEFLLTDYFEEDLNNAMNKERQESSIKSKLSRLQRDIEKTSRDREGLERMLKAYSNHSSFSDPESQKNTAALMDETNVKLDLLQANSYKLLSVLAELKQRPQPSHSCSNSIFKWKEKQQTHSYVKLSRPFLMKRSENVVSREPSGEQNNPNSPSTASSVAQHGNNLCKALYPFQARQDDELNLEKGDIVTLHQKKGEGWWFGSLKGKKGHFPAAYVEELPSNAGDTGIRQGSQRATLHTL
ncbi:PREDICTED: nostrin isoform X7 [Hipposideros armiger]|uniref:Nostrin n=1 Tax=Hipposideros armiger TaxID=186990 RepID=A0A8B7SHS5_HIPAR|nr:PREDICTED: nostrin isoform X7 [Hipposideros armiger]